MYGPIYLTLCTGTLGPTLVLRCPAAFSRTLNMLLLQGVERQRRYQ